jgi:hypothetical protein
MENEEVITAPISTESAPIQTEATIAPVEVSAPVETPIISETPTTLPEAPPEPETPSHPTSLLAELESTPKEEVKTSEAKTEDVIDAEKKETDLAEEPKPLEPMVYEEFKAPEGVKIDKEKVEQFTKAIGEHRLPQEVAQKLFDMHVAEISSITQKAHADQWDVYNQTRKEWRNRVLSDPEIGGSGHQTAMKIIAEGRNHIVPESERAEFNEMLNITGVGDHPALLKAFYRAGKILQAPETLQVPIKPSPDRGEKPQTKYANIYTHPTSKM